MILLFIISTYRNISKITIFAESENGDIDLTDTFSINQTNAKECEESNIKLLLKDGWQLLALPTDKEVTDLSKFGNYKSIWSYQNGTWQKPTTLKPEIGFWINSNSQKSISFEGESYNPNLIKLNDGWSLIGTGKNISDIGGIGFDSVWGYKDGIWSLNPSLINAGEGFWIKR